MHIAYNVPRAGDRNPVLRLRQGCGACTLLCTGLLFGLRMDCNFSSTNRINIISKMS